MPDTASPETDDSTPFAYTVSDGFAEAMAALNATLWVSTYQAGKLAVFRSNEGRVSMLPRTFDKAMGFAIDDRQLTIATRYQVWTLKNEMILAPRMKPEGTHDACYLPRSSHVTGNIDAHEVAVGRDGNDQTVWVVNTLFCCLCSLDPEYSFVPRWRPSFVSQLIRQDRCHLNGLAMHDGQPKFVTCFAETDTFEGWREHKRDGGLLIDVPSGEIVARGFSMPHSPRIHNGRLYMLDSGNGRLVTVDPQNGQVDIVADLPGYTRGLAFLGRYAFIGLSQIRETNIFGGIAIAEKPEERRCGVWVVDLKTGEGVGQIQFEKTIQEIFDIQVLPESRNPAIVGFAKETIQRACVIGPETPPGASLTPADSLATNPLAARPQQPSLSQDSSLPTATADARALNQLGLQQYQAGEREKAADLFRQAIQKQPDYAKGHSNLGNVLTELDRAGEAERHCRRATELAPDYATAHNNLGNALRRLNKPQEAAVALERAIELKPDYANAHISLSVVYSALNRDAEAEAILDRARDLGGDRSLIGETLLEAGLLEAAERIFRQLLDEQPNAPKALYGMGDVLLAQDHYEEAIAHFDKALEIDPKSARVWNNRGLTRQRSGRVESSLDDYREALRLQPDNEGVHRNLGYALLSLGRMTDAWPHFEWRWKGKELTDPPMTQPRWDGTPLNGRTLVLHTEQGLGDTLQFVRFACELAVSETGRVIVSCQPKLVPLLSRCPGIEVEPLEGSVPDCDFHAPVMSIPAIQRRTLVEIAPSGPHLFARDDLRERWQAELQNVPGLRVGIAWQGNPEFKMDRHRSIPLAHFQALAEQDGVTLISLQKGFGSEQLDTVSFDVVNLAPKLDVETGAFEDTAAVMRELDVIVTSDTSIAHLAGGLGVPVWVALGFAPDWRFMLDSDGCPWYPEMRLFRQKESGDWNEVFCRIGEELKSLQRSVPAAGSSHDPDS